jgi:hypothetical protein
MTITLPQFIFEDAWSELYGLRAGWHEYSSIFLGEIIPQVAFGCKREKTLKRGLEHPVRHDISLERRKKKTVPCLEGSIGIIDVSVKTKRLVIK